MTSAVQLSVVIPCCGGADDTRACLEALAAQRGVEPFETIIVDNGCTDHTLEVAARAGARTVSLGENRGFAGGVNAGLLVASGSTIVVLNNDTMPAPSMLAHLCAALAQHPDLGAVAPVSNAVKGPARLPIGDRGATHAGRIEVEAELAAVPPLQDVPTLSGLCLAMGRDLWQAAGGFDERFGPGNFEDDDLCLRLRLEGHRLAIARRAFVHHLGHRSFDRLGFDYRRELRTRRRQFDDKWCDHPAGRAWSAWIDGDMTRAAAEARRAATLAPRWVDRPRLEAFAAAAEGDLGAAVSRLEAYLERCPLDTAAIADLTWHLVRAGRGARARQWLGWAAARCWFDPTLLADLLARLAGAALEAREPARALAFADDGLAVAESRGDLHNLRGAALLACGRAREARAAFERGAQAGDREAACNVGVAAWEAGDRQGALRCWTELVAADPDHVRARDHLRRVAEAFAAASPPPNRSAS